MKKSVLFLVVAVMICFLCACSNTIEDDGLVTVYLPVSRTNSSGATTTYRYNERGMMTAMENTDLCISYTYNEHGHITAVNRNWNTGSELTEYEYRYDDNQRVAAYTVKKGAETEFFCLEYDAAGNLTQFCREDGFFKITLASLAYRQDGKLSEIECSDGTKKTGMVSVDYDQDDRLIAIRPNWNVDENSYSDLFGNHTYLDYDDNGRISKIANYMGGSTGWVLSYTEQGVLDTVKTPNLSHVLIIDENGCIESVVRGSSYTYQAIRLTPEDAERALRLFDFPNTPIHCVNNIIYSFLPCPDFKYF